jgi:pyridoxal phosphate enzyme (YggS family)
MTEQEQRALRERYLGVRARIDEAARRAGRAPGSVGLIAVSKLHGADMVRALAALGQRAFGESYVQEARAKQAALADLDVEWHYVGRIQSNKARETAGRFALLHAVDSAHLALALHRRLPEGAAPQPVLIQVNIGDEAQKAGVAPAQLDALADQIVALSNLELVGLMCLPPIGSGSETRPFFARLRELLDALARRLGMALPCLSMGMSEDFAEAVAEGATMVRIGTAIFGPRGDGNGCMPTPDGN